MERERERERDRQTNRQTDRQTDRGRGRQRQTEGDRDRETDRQTETDCKQGSLRPMLCRLGDRTAARGVGFVGMCLMKRSGGTGAADMWRQKPAINHPKSLQRSCLPWT